MPLIRTLPLPSRRDPRRQTADPKIMTSHFLRQIEANHVRTPSQTRPVPLHFNWITQSLSEWSWPYDSEAQRRIPLCELESFRRTHHFKAPSCLCALMEGKRYTESRIAIVETVRDGSDRNQSILNGEYVAACVKQRCGYFVALERFYPLIHLRLQMCKRRENPLEPQELATISDIDRSLRQGDGLFQLMTDVVVRGSGKGKLEKVNPAISEDAKRALVAEILDGMPEQRFWATFVQCLVCKDVTLRKNFALTHECGDRASRKGFRRVRPYPRASPGTPTPPSSGGFRSMETLQTGSSPTPTETAEFDCNEGYDVFGDLEFVGLLVGDEPERSLSAGISTLQDASGTFESGDGVGAASDGYLADDDDHVPAESPTSPEVFPSDLGSPFEFPSLVELSTRGGSDSDSESD